MGDVAVVCGGRGLKPSLRIVARLTDYIGWLRYKGDLAKVIQGGCTGADKIAKDVCLSIGFLCDEYPADWKAHGKAAGPIRNAEMAKIADVCIALPGGRGTEDMVNKMLGLGKPVYRISGD